MFGISSTTEWRQVGIAVNRPARLSRAGQYPSVEARASRTGRQRHERGRFRAALPGGLCRQGPGTGRKPTASGKRPGRTVPRPFERGAKILGALRHAKEFRFDWCYKCGISKTVCTSLPAI